MNKIKWMVCFSLLLLSGICRADGLSPVAQQEITHLFSYLGSSGCQFNRNGSWYDAGEAVDHINSKYQYLIGKDQISSAEDFIAKAASQSSMSGKPYLVRCKDAAPIESAGWFQDELVKYRQSILKITSKH